MNVSLNFITRIGGMLICAYLGYQVGSYLSGDSFDRLETIATQLLMLAGAGLGLLSAPRIIIDPVRFMMQRIRVIPLVELFLIVVGGLIGAIFAALVTVPLTMLPDPIGQFAPLVIAVLLIYLGVFSTSQRRREILDVLKNYFQFQPRSANSEPSGEEQGALNQTAPPQSYLLDTSAIIDGRIAAVVQTGFLSGTLLVPNFVLLELQDLADSSDELRRNKGRRGLSILADMQKNSPIPVEVLNAEVSGSARVDDRLIIVARRMNIPIITNDFNLNRVAGIQGIRVLSLNQLSDAIRPPVVQDQHLNLLIRNEGNVRQQGVGYLEDGTPVFVEDARALIGETVDVVVTRLLQTQSGRMVFAVLSNGGGEAQRNAS